MRGQRMPIRNKEKAIILLLHLQETLHGSEIVTQMQVACGPDATHYSLHSFVRFVKILIAAKIAIK